MARQWYERDPARLRAEAAAFKARFPKFQLFKTPAGQLYWTGVIILVPGAPRYQYQIRIVYPHTYPLVSPRIFVDKPKLPASLHQFFDGGLCVHRPWRPSRSNAASLVPLAAAWCARHACWREFGDHF